VRQAIADYAKLGIEEGVVGKDHLLWGVDPSRGVPGGVCSRLVDGGCGFSSTFVDTIVVRIVGWFWFCKAIAL
jgi:hypothetical protein